VASAGDERGVGDSFVGGVGTAVVTSLPELVTVFAAVRTGALTLAVGDIVGGNAFDVLFVAAADLAYREGPVYQAIGGGTLYLGALALLLSSVLAVGMIHRARAGIGFEGITILLLYAVGMAGLAYVG
jgi:cation:H+ antiporter